MWKLELVLVGRVEGGVESFRVCCFCSCIVEEVGRFYRIRIWGGGVV